VRIGTFLPMFAKLSHFARLFFNLEQKKTANYGTGTGCVSMMPKTVAIETLFFCFKFFKPCFFISNFSETEKFIKLIPVPGTGTVPVMYNES
jgi:hypothetical protein